MTSGRLAFAVAVLAMLCVVSIFFFPALRGPYPAVHGPVTALLSARAAASLRHAIMSAGMSAVRNCLDRIRIAAMPALCFASMVNLYSELVRDPLRESHSVILRC